MSSSNTLLNGKKVLIIGGSSGIGRSVAAASLSNGASVVIASSTQSKVDAAVELLKKDIEGKPNVTVSGHSFDIKDFAALTGFLTKEAPFDHLIITVGDIPNAVPTPDRDLREQFQDSMHSRYWAVLNAANHVHKHNLVRPGGSLTFTIGISQQRPFPGWGFFIGVAGAVETATRGLAVDLKPLRHVDYNIYVCIELTLFILASPGLVDTELTQGFPAEIRDPLFESSREKLLVGHVATPDEVAEAYIFAMKCRYLTGQIITVDGGGVLV